MLSTPSTNAEPTIDQAVLDAIYRKSPLAFAMRAMLVLEPATPITPNWHHKAIELKLLRAFNGIAKKIVINQPPKTLKTHLISVSFVAWLLLRNPDKKIAILCHDEGLAAKIVRQIRQIMKSQWYLALAPNTHIAKDKDSETLFETTAGGEVRAFSMQGGITGHGFDVIIIDDPQKASTAHSKVERENVENAYKSAISSRWRDPSSGILILVMQRLHVDDFTTYILKNLSEVEHLSIPAKATKTQEYQLSDGKTYKFCEGELLEPDRLTEAYLAEQRKIQGYDYFYAQYMQNPHMTAGRIIDVSWFKPYDIPRTHDYRVISIDPGFSEGKGCMSAALVCGLVGDDIEILHAAQGQFHYPGLLSWIRTLDKTWKPDTIPIETMGPGMGLPSALDEYGISHYVKIDRHAGKSKLARMQMASRHIEEGHVWLPQQAPWLDEFLERMAEFPHGPSDDWPDALSQLIIHLEIIRYWAATYRERRNPPPPPEPQTGLRYGFHYRRFDFSL